MIDVAIDDGIAVLTMRHGKANALDIEFCEALAARFTDLRGGDAKAVVLTGQGKIFSAGVDLKRISAEGADYVRRFLPALHRLYDAVFFHPKPVVAAINGHAIAGGAVLAACADRRVMANDGGRIGVTELLVGVPFPALAFEIVRHATPPYFFSETILSGATFPAEAAVHRGWVERGGRARPADGARDGRGARARRAVAAGFRADQDADPPAGRRALRRQRRGDRQGGHRASGAPTRRSAISATMSRARCKK